MDRSSKITLAVIGLVIVAAGYFTWQSVLNRTLNVDDLPDDNFERVSALGGFTDLEGNPVSLEDFRGKVLVVNSWASWCPFCVNELPDFSTLGLELADQGVVVLAINRAESTRQVNDYLDSIGEQPGITWLLNETDSFYSFIGGFTMPETVFYDTEGNMVIHKRGFMELSEMRELTRRTISASNPAS